ncbi:MAG: ribonuclease H-like domain-containing protein, partial [Polyangiaceae bacterium]|nr:ribonuclease H-like domain-containing protein [Polyangiaceae bacterium]
AVHVVETYLEPQHRHGRASVARALGVDPITVAQLALDPAISGVDLRRALYLDTETTGLSGGTGTVPFLVGMATFEDESLRVTQMFLPELGREAPMLAVLAEHIERASCIITYNGKSFDWPLLRTRFVMNRVKAPPLPPHLDLLHCARRAFKARFASMRLCEMERQLLSMIREHDVDGAEIPGIYLTFLRTGSEPRLARVIEHNANDLIALAALLGELEARYAEVRPIDDPLDYLAFARIAHRAGDAAKATAFALAAARGGGAPDCSVEALFLTARLARAEGALDREERALIEAFELAPPVARGRIALALAKLYEHRLRDPERALSYAILAATEEESEPHGRRLARLRRRLAAKKP